MFNNTINNDTSASAFSGSQMDIEYKHEIPTKESEQKQMNVDQRSLSQITIKQIMNAKPPSESEYLMIDGKAITCVEMMVIIKSIEFDQSSMTMIVNDLTGGELKVKRWAMSNEDIKQNKYDELKVGKWIRILGRMKHFNGVCSVDAFFVEAIKLNNFDALTHHLCSVIYQHEQKQRKINDIKKANLKKNKQNAALSLGITLHNDDNIIFKESLLPNNAGLPKEAKESSNGKRYGAPDEQTSTQKLDALIIDTIRRYSNDDMGCSIEDVFQILSNETMEDISQRIVCLKDDGYIYTTLDDETYKVCEDNEY